MPARQWNLPKCKLRQKVLPKDYSHTAFCAWRRLPVPIPGGESPGAPTASIRWIIAHPSRL